MNRILTIFLLAPLSAYAQATLTGAMWFSSTPNGAGSVSMGYADGAANTVGGDQWYNLWLALNPDATLPVNGPSDTQAGISIPLQAGNSYKYYIFSVGICCTLSYSGLNLFFDGNGATPGISVFGPLDTTSFLPNRSSTLSLDANPVPGSGSTFYRSAGVIVLLTGYDWNNSATPPGDVCQAFTFTPEPGDVPSAFGSFTLQVWPAASLTLSQATGSPGTKVTIMGSGFAARETVDIYANHPGGSLPIAVTTDAGGAFAVTVPEAQHPYGPEELFAVGVSSGKLGVAGLLVTPDIVMQPGAGEPGGAAVAQGHGFGAGEAVDIYWANPRRLLGSTVTDGVGSNVLEITIPADAARGINEVIGIGQTTKALGVGAIVVQ